MGKRGVALFFFAMGLFCFGAAPVSPTIRLSVVPTSLVTCDQPPLQKIDLTIESAQVLGRCALTVWAGERLLADKPLGALTGGTHRVSVLLPEPEASVQTRWVLSDASGPLAETALTWNPPRHWTLYVIKSSHVDIGLHDPQYKQRLLSVNNIDQATGLADQTAGWPDASRFRYVIEGLWWWGNYLSDRPAPRVDAVVEKYVTSGLFGIGASHSGNHTQVFGNEELCRSTYAAQRMRDRWRLPMDTMLMVDNNGITWPLVTVYADAGIKYLGFFPNAWNPATVGGSRIETGWDSALPHLFYWQGPDAASRLLVWADPHYIYTGDSFGIKTCRSKQLATPETVEPQMAKHLALLESKYPYDLWLVPNYDDNEVPSLHFSNLAKAWNARWRWPELRTVGELSEPFREVERRFGDKIPTLRGDMTGGWAQHPLSTPALLAAKREADRLLPTAEKLATLARLADPAFTYPAQAFGRAWDALICNDEHGYGVSYYKGRPVYDTWMQKRDWIERAQATATEESARALQALAAQCPAEGPSVFVFNPTLQPRVETVAVTLPDSCASLRAVRDPGGTFAVSVADGKDLRFRTSVIPSMGYALFRLEPGESSGSLNCALSAQPPTIENEYYRIRFGAAGAITSLFDKKLGQELVDASAPYRCNQFVYTRDVHKTFSSPGQARFEIETSPLGQTVVARMDDPVSGAAIEQRVTLPAEERRVEIDNRLEHVSDLATTNRWHRFGYYAFPFAVAKPVFHIGLNGCSARPHADQTGHGTDAYSAARDWAHVGNDTFGVTLAQLDSSLVECGKIHSDKRAFGETPAVSHLYAYLFNDWLYAHAWTTGPSHINLRYRYVITSHSGGVESAHAARFAARSVTPVMAAVIPQAQLGSLPKDAHSFLSTAAANVELLALKLSERPNGGVIARFHESDGHAMAAAGVHVGWGKNVRVTQCSIAEQDRVALPASTFAIAPFGYVTLRFEEPGAVLATPEVRADGLARTDVAEDAPPAKVGSVYTGLISDPRAWRGDTPDLLYLQWGQSRESDLSHYELFRGNTPDFTLGDKTRIAIVQPGPYVVVPFEDTGLKPHTAYYYRVRAIDRAGHAGEPSDVCTGVTKEH